MFSNKIVILGLFLISSVSFASREAANGGDIVYCQVDNVEAIRVLDSAVVRNSPYFDIVSYKSFDEAHANIQSLIDQVFPMDFSLNLREFIQIYNSKRNIEKSTFWRPGRPKQLFDENLLQELPENCRAKGIHQAVNRTDDNGDLTYIYEPQIFKKLVQQGDELSWMLYHEFLRDYVDDARIIRKLNNYLHSQQFINDVANKDIQAIQRVFSKHGVDIKKSSFTMSDLLRKEKSLDEHIIPEIEVVFNHIFNGAGLPNGKKLGHYYYTLKLYGEIKATRTLPKIYTFTKVSLIKDYHDVFSYSDKKDYYIKKVREPWKQIKHELDKRDKEERAETRANKL